MSAPALHLEPPAFASSHSGPTRRTISTSSFWGRGLAAEASRALLRHAFESLDFPEVRASTDVANAASLRVLEKLGMRRERSATVQGWRPCSSASAED